MRSLVVSSFLLLASCGTPTAELRPIIASIYPHHGEATARFRVPPHWILKNNEENSSGWIVVPNGSGDERSPAIIVDYYRYFDPSRRIDQQREAESELEEIHHHNDENVVMDVAASFDGGRHGRLSVYRYRSDYWGDRRLVFVADHDRLVKIELYARSASEADASQEALESIARSLVFPNA